MRDGIVVKLFRWPVCILTYVAFGAAVGYLSIAPRYDYASAEMAQVKVSLSHAAERVEPCVQLTPQQIAELAPNMRRTEQCERQRLPLTIELDVDERTVLRLVAPPSGLWGDGPSSVYERFTLAPGAHRITARLRETDRSEGWDYTHTEDVTLRAGRYFSVTFKAETGGFKFR